MTPDPNANSHEGAHRPSRWGKQYQHSLFSIFYQEPVDLRDLVASCDELDTPDIAKPGWYWEDAAETPAGPFRTSALAYVDATKGNYP